jgi:hypothetical protein
VQKNKSGKITFHVVNIRSFSDVKELGKWCYKTTKEKNNKIKEYGNFVDIVFQEEFSTEEINEIVMILLNEKVYTNEIIIIDESMIRKYKWKPEFKK